MVAQSVRQATTELIETEYIKAIQACRRLRDECRTTKSRESALAFGREKEWATTLAIDVRRDAHTDIYADFDAPIFVSGLIADPLPDDPGEVCACCGGIDGHCGDCLRVS